MPADFPRLTRDGAAPEIGIVHLGPGAFFRAFNAIYTDEVRGDAAWGICAVSLRSPTARDQLEPQGGAYTSVELGPEGESRRVIGAISKVLVAPDDPGAVVATMADPAVKIVSLTITEKGYCHHPASGRLDPAHADVVHDLAQLETPRSAIGFLVSALKARREAGVPPFTILPCDNLPSNGALVRQVVLDFAAAVSAELAAWIAKEVPFPATMVDRITPATTPDDVARLASVAGYHDPGMVVHEPFRQWVIEDNFACGRPAWEQAGAQFVESVEAHELMKLRCLNGTHSTLAYLGYLGGHETIAEAVADEVYARLIERLWRDEILPTIPQPEGEDLLGYAEALLARYRNPAIRHRTWQIAMDGSQKLPQRLLGTIRDNLSAGRDVSGLCLAVAGWMRYVGGVDEAGAAIDVRDPLADALRQAFDSSAEAEGKVAALLAMREVFDADLAADATFVAAVQSGFDAISRLGARGAVEDWLGRSGG